jgi:hypothetical protein
MRSKHCLVLLALCLLACSDMTIFRAGQDYFSLTSGTRWIYDDAGFTSIDSVAGDSTVGGRNAIVVLRDFSPEFWLKGPTEIRRFVRRSVIRAGTEYVLEERYGIEYQLPLVKGATWEESFRDTVVLMGTDTIFVKDSVSARVAEIENVETPAGTFVECYQVDFYREVQTDTAATTRYSEWLAPGVGVVKRRTETEERVLTDYQVGH